MATYLDRIVAAHRAVAARDERPLGELVRKASACPPPRGFAAALVAGQELSVIAEIKRRSPSRGHLSQDLVPRDLAGAYAAGGASCLSVLTDRRFFGGSPADLIEARKATRIPVLRKDFTVDERDVADARLMGADAVLLIVAALSDDELVRFSRLADELGLTTLVEVHDAEELDRGLSADAGVIGVNQRDLATFSIDRELAARLAPSIPKGIVKVAESGVRHEADATVIAEAGYDAVLVGETLVTAPDPGAVLAGLRVRGAASGDVARCS